MEIDVNDVQEWAKPFEGERALQAILLQDCTVYSGVFNRLLRILIQATAIGKISGIITVSFISFKSVSNVTGPYRFIPSNGYTVTIREELISNTASIDPVTLTAGTGVYSGTIGAQQDKIYTEAINSHIRNAPTE